MAQWAQLLPQEDFPCFFCRISERAIRNTTASRMMHVTIVPILEEIHCSIAIHFFSKENYIWESFVASL